MRTFPIVAFAVLAACTPADRKSGGPADTPRAGAGTITTPDALAGAYRIAGFDGGELGLGHGIAASISESEILVESQCVRWKWSYAFTGAGLSTERVPIISCERGLYPAEDAIARAFDAADRVQRTPENGIRFAGEGHTVTLFSQ